MTVQPDELGDEQWVNPRSVRHYNDAEESFLARTERLGSCLVWTASKYYNGYGQMKVNGKPGRAHRYAWERANGPIPEGMVIDHVCHNPACCEVTHLRLASRKQNMEHRKGATAKSKSGIRGVSWSKDNSAWRGTVQHNGRQYSKQFPGTEAGKLAAARWAAEKRAELFTHSIERGSLDSAA